MASVRPVLALVNHVFHNWCLPCVRWWWFCLVILCGYYCVFLSNTDSQAGQVLVSQPETGTGNVMGVLPNASGSSWPPQPFVGVMVWPSVWILTSGSKSSRLLDLVAIDMKTVVVNWNSRCVCTDWVQKPLQENKDTNWLVITVSYPWWVRDLFICHQQIPFTNMGMFPTREKVLTSLHKPPEWQFKGWSWTVTAPHCWTRPLGSCHFFSSPPRDARKCNCHQGYWLDQWAHQSCNLSCVHQFTLKDCSPCHSNTRFEWIQGVSYLASSASDWSRLTQGVQGRLGHLWLKK